jgi:hypothetical protein
MERGLRQVTPSGLFRLDVPGWFGGGDAAGCPGAGLRGRAGGHDHVKNGAGHADPAS